MSILHYLNNMKNKNKLTTLSSQKKIVTSYDIFTDGSEIKHSTTHKTLAVGWSYVIHKNRDHYYEYADCIRDIQIGNNQRAELMALYQALQKMLLIIDEPSQINIYTDSEYSLKSLTIWCHNWKNNGWKTANKKPVKHRDLIEQSMSYMNNLKSKGCSLSILHVKAHTEKKDYISLGNSQADRLAQLSAKRMLKE
jgi:ribonuclease HI